MPRIPTEFHSHSIRSTPRNPLSHERILKVCYAYRKLHEAYVASGGQITSALYTTMLDIDREIISWEQRSSRLRYAARKQSEARAAKRADSETLPRNSLDDVRDDSDGTHTGEDFDFGDSSQTSESSIIPDATKSALAKYKAERGVAAPPDNTGYKKSGLV